MTGLALLHIGRQKGAETALGVTEGMLPTILPRRVVLGHSPLLQTLCIRGKKSRQFHVQQVLPMADVRIDLKEFIQGGIILGKKFLNRQSTLIVNTKILSHRCTGEPCITAMLRVPWAEAPSLNT